MTTSVPGELARRPGLPSVEHRVGVHATFLESMLAGLSSWPVTRPDDEVASWLFDTTDLPDPAGLARRLETSSDLAVAFLWSQFPEDERAAIAAGDEVASVLVERFNAIVRGPSIHTDERFATRVLDRRTQELLAADRTPTEQRQLNRLLLEAALGRLVRASRTIQPLDRLTTRESGDFSIALLDGWATVADIVTFYQERLVDEGYLPTATERRSVLELARLVGYEPRPGVSASVFLAFTLQDGHEVDVPAGTLAKSTPAPGELPQPFETSEPLAARAEWNVLRPRMSRPQRLVTANAGQGKQLEQLGQLDRLYLAGTATKLATNDFILLTPGPHLQVLRRIEAVEEDADAKRSLVRLQPQEPADSMSEPAIGFGVEGSVTALDAFRNLELGGPLSVPRTVQPPNRLRLGINIAQAFAKSGDLRPKLLTKLQPSYAPKLYQALAGAHVLPDQPVEVFAFRVRASLYGHTAPQRPLTFNTENGTITNTGDPESDERPDTVDLAQPYDDILPGSWVVVRRPQLNENGDVLAGDDEEIFALAGDPDPTVARADYGIASKVTRIRLLNPASPTQFVTWYPDEDDEVNAVSPSFDVIRSTHVLAQAEPLQLAEEPILAGETPEPGRSDELRPVAGDRIELDALHEGLEPGRWLVVTGQRSDIGDVTGVEAAELVMLGGVEHRADPTRPGESLHTFLALAGRGASGSPGLSYSYRRDSVRIYGNVVRATHGETVRQVLGSGDGTAALQRFSLGKSPLTHVSAPTPAGAAAELEVRVNGVSWQLSPSLVELGPSDRGYIIRTDDDAVTTVVVGDGRHGARLPSGAENVTAEYRTGIGLSGNVPAKQIDTLIDRPLGAKEVINPIEASGGADRESRDRARANAPLAVMALDRLVSVRDYADFARTFAGVDKADARLLSSDRRRVLHLTVALAGDAPLDRNGDLYRNLRQALSDFGDSGLELRLDERGLRLMVLSARVRIAANQLWENVEPRIRLALADVLGFERRELGRGIARSEALTAIHKVRGVEYVDVDVFEWVDEARILDLNEDRQDRTHATASRRRSGDASGPNAVIDAPPAHIDEVTGRIVPAQLVYADPTTRDTVILEELTR